MKYNPNILMTAVLVVVTLVLAGSAVAGSILVANHDVADDTLTAGQVKNIFLGKSAQWSDGTRVVLSMLKSGDVSKQFLKTYVKKSQKQFTTFWKKAVFSGTGEMPASFETEADLVMYVAKTPGAVGYIDEATPHDGVKVIPIN